MRARRSGLPVSAATIRPRMTPVPVAGCAGCCARDGLALHAARTMTMATMFLKMYISLRLIHERKFGFLRNNHELQRKRLRFPCRQREPLRALPQRLEILRFIPRALFHVVER